MHHEHERPSSFLSSPQEAIRAPREEFLYLVCLREGTGVAAPDFLAVVDAERGRIVHELSMPNVGDELHHFGWNRCSSACHGPDRSHLIVPGFRSSRFHVINVAESSHVDLGSCMPVAQAYGRHIRIPSPYVLRRPSIR